MKIDLFNIEKFIEANHCPQVTNPVFFNFDTTPTSDGLFSYELFGSSDLERKSIFGYIDLGNHYIHPLVWLMLTKRMGVVGDIAMGAKYGIIDNRGQLTVADEDTPGADTGIDFIYNNFERINWAAELDDKIVDSIDKRTRLQFLASLKKDEFFVDKWLVLPPFYRDESSTTQSMGDSINKLYKDLLSKVKSTKLGFSVQLFGTQARLRIQNILKELYLCTLAPVSGKNLVFEKGKQEGELKGSGKFSMIRRHLVGKTVDWGAYTVITSPTNSDATKYKDKPVPFGAALFPMAVCLSMFNPFYAEWVSQTLEIILQEIAMYQSNDIKRINAGQFTSDKIQKMIKDFIYSPRNRFDPINYEYTDNNGNLQKYSFTVREKTKNGSFARAMTYTDLFYAASIDVLQNKHAYVTRFPIANFQNLFPCRVLVASTAVTRSADIDLSSGHGYKHYGQYPMIPKPGEDYEHNPDYQFRDVTVIGNAVLATLNADYDGDMVFMRAVFSEEANNETEKLIWSKKNMLNAKGELSRSIKDIGKDAVLSIYELTKDGPTE